ncbi:NAC domain-containing protein 78 [Amborella trichopoda]|uniref:NAC domain-containing protein n=1 Tax=Amborella trichopoda TaxID=13333 RepID=W1PB15_AMBTC|nr:NAC domain-containing protein 78 [Amborella trichopoda]ERN04791.1 hypothetical protein AMTR_s00140p00087970 [Amborella trichopoda]|eukprot:XP_006843116.1 NAC domain-containing protein 78 [Amborella trichopoda]
MGKVSLPPGFRFHPTDEEIVSYYLKRKVCGKSLHCNAISQIDLYKSEPWDLPGQSLLKTRDLEWYFFSPLDKKHGKGSRTNRATEIGFWKTTGKDRPIRRNGRTVGMKKTLVFHVGRAPNGERTNWVMHEYRLEDKELNDKGIVQDAYVLCRIFQKNGPGPRNGAQYGAPFNEEEWEDDVVADSLIPLPMVSGVAPSSEPQMNQLVVVPKQEMDELVSDQAPILDGSSGSTNENIFSSYIKSHAHDLKDEDNVQLQPANEDDFAWLSHENGFLQHNGDNQELNAGLLIDGFHAYDLDDMEENAYDGEAHQMLTPIDDDSFLEVNDILKHIDTQKCEAETVEPEAEMVEPFTYFDTVIDNPVIEDGSFLEMKDVLNPLEPEPDESEFLDDILNFFDTVDDDSNPVLPDLSARLPVNEDYKPEQSKMVTKVDVEGSLQGYAANPHTHETTHVHGVEGASSSEQKADPFTGTGDKFIKGKVDKISEPTDVPSDESFDGLFSKRFQNMLGCIPARPALAAEYPTKGGLKLSQNEAYAGASINVTAATVHITHMSFMGSDTKAWPLHDSRHMDYLLSDGIVMDDLMVRKSSVSLGELVLGTFSSDMVVVLRGGFAFFFMLLVLLGVSYRFGKLKVFFGSALL